MKSPANHRDVMHRNLLIVTFFGLIICIPLTVSNANGAENPSSPPVFSIREFELRSGVKPQEFENYVRQDLTRALSQAKTGAHFRILKGDRGDRKGGYILIWEFESVAARNEFFPKEGGGASAACQQQWKRIKLAMEKFSIYVKEKHSYTDYVAVAD